MNKFYRFLGNGNGAPWFSSRSWRVPLRALRLTAFDRKARQEMQRRTQRKSYLCFARVTLFVFALSFARFGRAQTGAAGEPIPPTFFACTLIASNSMATSPFGSLRMLGNLTTWFHLEGAGRNRYDWRMLDGWLNAARPRRRCDVHLQPHAGLGCGQFSRSLRPRRDSADCAPPADLMTTAACQGPLAGVTTTDANSRSSLPVCSITSALAPLRTRAAASLRSPAGMSRTLTALVGPTRRARRCAPTW